MSHTEGPGDNVDHGAQLRDVMADYRDLKAENKALLLRLDSAESAAAAARHMYDQEYGIVARIWELYGNPSYDDLKGRSIYDLVKESIDRAQSAEYRLDSARKLLDEAIDCVTLRLPSDWFARANAAGLLLRPNDAIPVDVRCGNANCGALLSAGEPHTDRCVCGEGHPVSGRECWLPSGHRCDHNDGTNDWPIVVETPLPK